MIPLTWTEDRATQRCDPSAVPGAKTGGGAGLRLAPLPSPLRDWHQRDKPSRQDAATILQDAPFNPLACTTELPFHAEPRQLYLPSYSPNLNLIERLWKFIKRRELYGKYHARFDDFRIAINTCLSQISTVHRDPLKSLMTLNFQTFENVSLLAV